MLKANYIVLTATRVFFQIIHSNVYKRKQLQSTFLGKNQLLFGEYLTTIEKKLSVPRVQTAALIES